MRTALYVAGSALTARLGEWVHEAAGIVGDLGLIAGVTAAGYAAWRKKVRPRIAARWATVEAIAANSAQVPGLRADFDGHRREFEEHRRETRDALEAGSVKFADLAAQMDVLAHGERAAVRGALEAVTSRDPRRRTDPV